MKDKAVQKLMQKEEARQKSVVNLIASENYVSGDVLEALGSVLTNKYAEGYPGLRYYGGNSVVDELETLTKERALALFGLSQNDWQVNVQALSGSPANLAVYLALVPMGGKIMGMALDHGGHLTHGHSVSVTGKFWKQVPYGVNKETELLEYEEIKRIAHKEKPNIIVAGFTAYPRAINFKHFREIADSVGAYLLIDMSHIAGLIATDAHPSPFIYADVVTSTVHKTLRGPRAALIFSKVDARGIPKKIDKAIFPGIQGGPHMNQITATAIALKEASTPKFKKYIAQVLKNARALADEFRDLGWRIVTDGTDTHLLLLDTWMGGKGMGGKEASDRLEKVGIIVNKNMIPFDIRNPEDPSGIRIGAAAETTRGKKEKDMRKIAKMINQILRNND